MEPNNGVDASTSFKVSREKGHTLNEKVSSGEVDLINGRIFQSLHLLDAQKKNGSPHNQIGAPLQEVHTVLGRTYEAIRIGGDVDYCLRRGCGSVLSSDGCTNDGCIDARPSALPFLSAVAVKYNMFGGSK